MQWPKLGWVPVQGRWGSSGEVLPDPGYGSGS